MTAYITEAAFNKRIIEQLKEIERNPENFSPKAAALLHNTYAPLLNKTQKFSDNTSKHGLFKSDNTLTPEQSAIINFNKLTIK